VVEPERASGHDRFGRQPGVIPVRCCWRAIAPRITSGSSDDGATSNVDVERSRHESWARRGGCSAYAIPRDARGPRAVLARVVRLASGDRAATDRLDPGHSARAVAPGAEGPWGTVGDRHGARRFPGPDRHNRAGGPSDASGQTLERRRIRRGGAAGASPARVPAGGADAWLSGGVRGDGAATIFSVSAWFAAPPVVGPRANLRAVGDRTSWRAWGSVASRYDCPVIVLLHAQAIERVTSLEP